MSETAQVRAHVQSTAPAVRAVLGMPDLLGLGLLSAILGLLLGVFYEWSAVPAEDAAMLMRYAQNLGDGHGIVWNIGEAPVDGATDFLFMLAMAALVSLGASLTTAAQILVVGAHVLTVDLIYWRTRRSGFGAGAATLAAAFFAAGPGLGYAEAFFGTPFFALWAAATWFFAIEVRDIARGTRAGSLIRAAMGCALAALALGLTRPDGVLLSGFAFAGLASQLSRRDALRVFACFAGVFGTLGIAYFVWRWSYFGHPLPNPYYKKGGFHLWVGSLVTAVKTVIHFLLPVAPFYLLALRDSRATREALFSAIPVAGFTAIWILLSDEMNYLGRFQYALVPIAVMSAPSLFAEVFRAWKLPRLSDIDGRGRGVVLAFAAIGGILLPLALFRPSLPPGIDGRAVIAEGLSAYADRDYTLATTEAGLLPLLSGWRAVDTWGLNDAEIAHSESGITVEYLDERAPEVVLIHGAWSPVFDDPRIGANLGPEWDEMTDLLRDWCRSRAYVLAAAWGASHTDTFQFWVAPRFSDHDAIVALIRDARFTAMGGPGPFVDFAQASGTLELAAPR